jgi:hypothetical protein
VDSDCLVNRGAKASVPVKKVKEITIKLINKNAFDMFAESLDSGDRSTSKDHN